MIRALIFVLLLLAPTTVAAKKIPEQLLKQDYLACMKNITASNQTLSENQKVIYCECISDNLYDNYELDEYMELSTMIVLHQQLPADVLKKLSSLTLTCITQVTQ